MSMFRHKGLSCRKSSLSVKEPKNLSIPISDALKSENLTMDDFQEGLSKYPVPGIGHYQCNNCSNNWSCHYAWAEVDLKEQMISNRWSMKCKKCRFSKFHTGVPPIFSSQEIKNLTKKAISLHRLEHFHGLGLEFYLLAWDAPHPKLLCEMCHWGKRKCWVLCHETMDVVEASQ